MKLSFGISVNSDLTNDLWGENTTHTRILFRLTAQTDDHLLQSVPWICNYYAALAEKSTS